MGLLKLINKLFSIKCYIQISYQQQPKTCFYNLFYFNFSLLEQSICLFDKVPLQDLFKQKAQCNKKVQNCKHTFITHDVRKIEVIKWFTCVIKNKFHLLFVKILMKGSDIIRSLTKVVKVFPNFTHQHDTML